MHCTINLSRRALCGFCRFLLMILKSLASYCDVSDLLQHKCPRLEFTLSGDQHRITLHSEAPLFAAKVTYWIHKLRAIYSELTHQRKPRIGSCQNSDTILENGNFVQSSIQMSELNC